MNLEVKRKALIVKIQNAFEGVVLGNGISLQQARDMDNWVPEPTRREDEITDDWRKVSAVDLEHHNPLAYVCPEGFRYYLPAYMLWTLQNLARYSPESSDEYVDTYKIDRVVYSLDLFDRLKDRQDLIDYKLNQFSLLSSRQSLAISHYLEFMAEYNEDIGEDYPSEYARKALEKYWGRFL